jgi:malonyl-CoA/methylmalonyl-CoA synthetase
MTMSKPHFFERILEHQQNIALIGDTYGSHSATSSSSSFSWNFEQLLKESIKLKTLLLQEYPQLNQQEGEEPRVAFVGARGVPYVVMQWAIWLAGAIAVPLHPENPLDELKYILSDSEAAVFLVSDSFLQYPNAKLSLLVSKIKETMKIPVKIYKVASKPSSNDQISADEKEELYKWIQHKDRSSYGAYIVYTSGTTGRPKGVVTTHGNLTAQIHDIVSEWQMSSSDHLLHFLPLHHVHGILNNLLCVHYAGASVEFLASAKPQLILSKLANTQSKKITMLMAVPTIYMNLLEELEKLPNSNKELASKAILGAKNLRVAISGSMACPVSILDRWEALTGHRLLERYGMTELGMVLTNPLHGERHLGFVGNTFPSVSVRLVDPDTDQELDLASGQEGELRVKGPTIFREYWKNPDATKKEFDPQGWFKTGDIAQYCIKRQSFRIRGRASADIIKSAGYKISALDIERVLLEHPQVKECAVFGLDDEKYGQIVAAVIRFDYESTDSDVDDRNVSEEDFDPPLSQYMNEHLVSYRVPRKYFFEKQILKNAMGKINKKSLAAFYLEKQTDKQKEQ